MPKILDENELDLIEHVVAQHAEGVGISSLKKALAKLIKPALSHRTVLRRLATLIDQKRIMTAHQGRALVYQRPTPTYISSPVISTFKLRNV